MAVIPVSVDESGSPNLSPAGRDFVVGKIGGGLEMMLKKKRSRITLPFVSSADTPRTRSSSSRHVVGVVLGPASVRTFLCSGRRA